MHGRYVNTFLLAGNKFMCQIHLRQQRFTQIYSTSSPFSKDKERIRKLKETSESKYVLKMYKLFKNKFVFNMIWRYGDYKDWARKIASGKVFVTNHLIFQLIQNMMDISMNSV